MPAVSPIRWVKYQAASIIPGLLPATVIIHPFTGTIFPTDMCLTLRGFTGASAVYNGTYINVSNTDVAVHLTTGTLTGLQALLTAGVLQKYASYPADNADLAKKWVAHERYMANDFVYVDVDAAALYLSAIDNNIQGVFQERWEYGAIAPPNMVSGLGTLTVGMRKYLEPRPNDPPNLKYMRKVRGALYWARDQKRLFVFDGNEWVDADQWCTIPNYDPLKDETVTPSVSIDDRYQIGDLVFGHLTGFYADSTYLKEVWGIFRRDDVKYYNVIDPIHLLTDGTAHLFGPGDYFYVDGFSSNLGNYNGIYQSTAQLAIAVTPNDANDLVDHLNSQVAGVRKLTAPPSPALITPWMPNMIYQAGQMVYDSSSSSPFSKIYICQYNEYRSTTFDPDATYRGWTCLADLDETDGWPYRKDAYIWFSNKSIFPNTGKNNTIYIDSVTGRIYYWDGTKYAHFSEEYPYIETFDAEFVAATTTTPLVFQMNWDEKTDENTSVHNEVRLVSNDKRFVLNQNAVGHVPSTGADEYELGYQFSPSFVYSSGLVPSVIDLTTPSLKKGIKLEWSEVIDDSTTYGRELEVFSRDERLKATPVMASQVNDILASLALELYMQYIRTMSATTVSQSAPLTHSVTFTQVAEDKTETVKTVTTSLNSDDSRLLLVKQDTQTANSETSVGLLKLYMSYIKSLNVSAKDETIIIKGTRVLDDGTEQTAESKYHFAAGSNAVTVVGTTTVPGSEQTLTIDLHKAQFVVRSIAGTISDLVITGYAVFTGNGHIFIQDAHMELTCGQAYPADPQTGIVPVITLPLQHPAQIDPDMIPLLVSGMEMPIHFIQTNDRSRGPGRILIKADDANLTNFRAEITPYNDLAQETYHYDYVHGQPQVAMNTDVVQNLWLEAGHPVPPVQPPDRPTDLSLPDSSAPYGAGRTWGVDPNQPDVFSPPFCDGTVTGTITQGNLYLFGDANGNRPYRWYAALVDDNTTGPFDTEAYLNTMLARGILTDRPALHGTNGDIIELIGVRYKLTGGDGDYELNLWDTYLLNGMVELYNGEDPIPQPDAPSSIHYEKEEKEYVVDLIAEGGLNVSVNPTPDPLTRDLVFTIIPIEYEEEP